jgi:orotate phosphoribosyltransferase-like protein
MLVLKTIARIRREHFIKGEAIKEIALDLKVSRNTVRKLLRSEEISFEYEAVSAAAANKAGAMGIGARRVAVGERGQIRT